MEKVKKKTKKRWTKSYLKKVMFGSNENSGLLGKLFIYLLLIILGFVFIYPIIYMISYSFKDLDDLLSSTVNWIPSHLYLGNFTKAIKVLEYAKTLGESLFISLVPSIIQMLICSIVGYGFAIYNFKGKTVFLGLVLSTFIIPPQITIIPRYILFNKLGILGTVLTYVLPASFGQGINSAIFILIFYQLFKTLPKVLLEAARLDGANELKIFFSIGVPSGFSGYLITFLFSLVWYWNETYLASIYFGNSLSTLPLQLQRFVASYNNMFKPSGASATSNINEGIELAATLLTIAPLLVLYFIAQKWFVESIDKSGITGE